MLRYTFLYNYGTLLSLQLYAILINATIFLNFNVLMELLLLIFKYHIPEYHLLGKDEVE
jgi:hypothetical protein